MQVIGRVNRSDGPDALSGARDVALDWLRRKKGWDITPTQACSSRPVHLEDETSTRGLWIESAPGLWAIRLDDPCAQVAGRQWRVELVLVDMGADQLPVFGCTLSVLVPIGNSEPVARPGVPAVIGMMARNCGLTDAGFDLGGNALQVDRPAEVDRLIRFIESPTRPVSVVLVSRPRQGRPFCDPARLAAALAGLAVVAEVTPEAAQEITDRYGRTFGVFGDALRLFRVGFDADADDRWRHPLFIAHSWANKPHAALSAIKAVAMADTVVKRDAQRDIPTFGVIRSIAADQRINAAIRSQSTTGIDSAQVAADIASLREQAQSWERYAIAEDERATAAEEGQRQTQARLYVYAEKIRKLEAELKAVRHERVVDVDHPLDEMTEWAEEYCTGRLVITPRAARAAASSCHLEPQLIYKCLHLLADQYWEMKVHGGNELHASCKAKEAELGVRISPTGEAADRREYEAEYRVRWEGRQYKLEMHLAGSDSRDLQRGLRIYFAWDADQQLVVVGHLPSHLTNSHT